MAKNSPPRALWLIALGVAGLLLAVGWYVPRNASHEVATVGSPDGTGEAVLLEVRGPPGATNGYKVCLRRPDGLPASGRNCTEVAYLAGVSGATGQPVDLVWISPTQLEIRYVNATSVHIYKPAFVWSVCRLGPCPSRYGFDLPISIRAVQSSKRAGKVSAR